jgi:hypothetical protein
VLDVVVGVFAEMNSCSEISRVVAPVGDEPQHLCLAGVSEPSPPCWLGPVERPRARSIW